MEILEPNDNKFTQLNAKDFHKTFCFSSCYTNKSACRSVLNNSKNILSRKNSKISDIIQDILETGQTVKRKCSPSLEKEIEKYLGITLLEIKDKFRKYAKDDFKVFFTPLKRTTKMKAFVDVKDIVNVMILILEYIVPKDFYGCNRNKKLFYKVAGLVINSMSHQCLTRDRIIHNWDLDSVTWLSFLPDVELKYVFLCKCLVWLLKCTVCCIISVVFYVTTTKLTQEMRKLYFYLKEDWQRFTDEYITMLLSKRYIKKCEPFSVGSCVKKKLTLESRRERRRVVKTLPIMRLMLKNDSSVRAIIKYKKKTQEDKYKAKSRSWLFKAIFPKKSTKFEDKYFEFFKQWKNENKPVLYFVKCDIRDAFGSVNLDLLQNVINELYTNFVSSTNVSKQRKLSMEKEYKRLVDDLKKPVMIRSGFCVYTWHHGLVQGMRYSPMLCEIFYDAIDKNCLQKFVENSEYNVQFFTRLVDDYLLITDNKNVALEFLELMCKSGRINVHKTVCNFEQRRTKPSTLIKFYGFVINTETLEVTRDLSAYSGQVRYRILFNSNISNTVDFLEKRIMQTTVPLIPLFFNLNINSEDTLWRNIFVTLCISANKFCSIVNMICCDNEKLNISDLFNAYKRKVAVKMCDAIIVIIEKFKNPSEIFMFCINHLRFLAFKALYLFACKANICVRMLPLIKVAMKKTNCVEGKWRPHFGSVNKNGDEGRPAVKEVCRQGVLKMFYSELTEVPKGFETFSK